MKIIKSTNKSKPIMLNNMRVFVPNKNKIDIIKNISKVVTGNTPSLKVKKYWCESNGFKWFSTPNFKDSVSGFLTKGSRFLTKDGASVSRICPMGTVIVSCIATVGEVAILNEDSAFNQQINGILPSEKINSLYLRYIFIYQKNNLINYAPKNVIMNINKSLFENYQISYNEDIKQQENIAYVLSTQEEQIERIKGLIKKLEKRNQYYAEKLLSGELRIRENKETGKTEFYENKEWQEFNVQGRIKKIPKYYTPILIKNCDFIKMTRGKVISKKDILNNPGDYPIYSSSTKNEGLLGKYKKYDFDQEMITWSVDGGGDLFFRKKHKYSVTNVSGIMTNTNPKVSLKYLYYLFKFQHKSFNFDYSSKAHPSVIKDLYFYTGIDIYEQLLIVNFLDKLNVEFESLQSTLTKEEKRFQWMLDNLLSGEYEVVED